MGGLENYIGKEVEVRASGWGQDEQGIAAEVGFGYFKGQLRRIDRVGGEIVGIAIDMGKYCISYSLRADDTGHARDIRHSVCHKGECVYRVG